MNRQSVETIVRILEECTDLECQNHSQETHIFNLFQWARFMITESLKKAINLFRGVQMRILTLILSTRIGTQAAALRMKSAIEKEKEKSKTLQEVVTVLDSKMG
ncbi:C (U2) putative protein [Burg el Arab virus]|uniref:Uncharacterized protein n=1 Tax=Burg el Arab virus TaxID=2686073 RepID=A0AAE9BMH4_9RHAB|nr:C (U2) putative protein [Burg el Arab virus]UAU42897.1 C (U2) putative protein [Burg el Arab virus]